MADQIIEASKPGDTNAESRSSQIGFFGTPEDFKLLTQSSELTGNSGDTKLNNLTIQDRAAKDVIENNSPYERNADLSKLFESVPKRLSGTANVSQLLRESGSEVTSTALAKQLKADLDTLVEGGDWTKQEFKGTTGKEELFKLLKSQDNGAVVLARRLANPDETGIRWSSEGNKKYKSHFVLDGPSQSVFHTINRPDEPSQAGKWSSEKMEMAIGFYDEFIVYNRKGGTASPDRVEQK